MEKSPETDDLRPCRATESRNDYSPSRLESSTRNHYRYSAWVIRSRCWPALRQAVLRRDGFRCRCCGARGRLEVDHIKPVRHAPELAFEIDNLQSLCPSCHSRKTRSEIGLPPPDPERAKWRRAVQSLIEG
jgi:5-methylcytosine-specific restriction endonuclease McrA